MIYIKRFNLYRCKSIVDTTHTKLRQSAGDIQINRRGFRHCHFMKAMSSDKVLHAIVYADDILAKLNPKKEAHRALKRDLCIFKEQMKELLFSQGLSNSQLRELKNTIHKADSCPADRKHQKRLADLYFNLAISTVEYKTSNSIDYKRELHQQDSNNLKTDSKRRRFLSNFAKNAKYQLVRLFISCSPSYLADKKTKDRKNNNNSQKPREFDYSHVKIKGVKDIWIKIAFKYYKAYYSKTINPNKHDSAKMLLLSYQSGNFLSALKPVSSLIRKGITAIPLSSGQYNMEIDNVKILKDILFNSRGYLKYNSCGVRYFDQIKDDVALFQRLVNMKESNADAKKIVNSLRNCDIEGKLKKIIMMEPRKESIAKSTRKSSSTKKERTSRSKCETKLSPFEIPAARQMPSPMN